MRFGGARPTLAVVGVIIAVNGVSVAIASFLLLRLLGVTEFGITSTAIILGNSMAALVSAAPSQSLYTLIGRTRDKSAERFGRILRRDALLLSAAAIVAGLAAWPLAPDIGRVAVESSSLVLAVAIAGFHAEAIRLMSSSRVAAGWNCARSMSAWASAIIAAVILPRSELVVAAYAMATLTIALLTARHQRRLTSRAGVAPELSPSRGPLAIRRLVALPAIASSYLLTFADRFYVVEILGKNPLGLYSFAYQLGEGALTLAFLPVTFVATVPIVSLWVQGDAPRRRALNLSILGSGAVLAVAGVFDVCVLVLSHTSLWGRVLGQHGSEGAEIARVAAIVAPGVGLAGLTRIPAAVLTRLGRAKTYTKISGSVLIGALVATAPATKYGGLTGCATVTAVAYLLIFVLAWSACLRSATPDDHA
jgi:O-antigen/teichoic acid export membrane protein